MLPVVVVAMVLVLVLLASRRRRRLPPGPKPSLIVGNLLQIPINRPWERYHEWLNAYSELTSLSTPIIPPQSDVLQSRISCT